MKLSRLTKDIPVLGGNAGPEENVSGISYDSRKVKPGDLFFCISGAEADGHDYAADAAKKGAVCCVCGRKPEADVPYIVVEDVRKAMSVMSGRFYGEPGRKMKIIGVTGTNGKTTTASMTARLIRFCTGAEVGVIGTTGAYYGENFIDVERTTPESVDLQRILCIMYEAGCEFAVMEVSSHGLCLDRVYGIPFFCGVFTNLTEDHLDFHRTMDAYAKAKAKLFSMCRFSVINADDDYGIVMAGSAAGRVLKYSAKGPGDLWAENISHSGGMTEFTACFQDERYNVRVNIPGMFTVYNSLAAMSAALLAGGDFKSVCRGMNGCGGVRGRAETVNAGQDFNVIIDYAHTPDALENIIGAMREISRGRIITLFGCGGDREREKRPQMGSIACRMSDYVVVTSDNPRTEEPHEIIWEILSGMKYTDTPYTVIPDRRQAICHALDVAAPGDTVIVAGKGHETYQILGRTKIHFDEREIIKEHLGRK
jgi:UDP-N-acetylmuramoyl-L-alanyl-D-glutamate--2,6-diaminopimelate ligase